MDTRVRLLKSACSYAPTPYRRVPGDVAAGLGIVGVADAAEGDVGVPGRQKPPVLHELGNLAAWRRNAEELCQETSVQCAKTKTKEGEKRTLVTHWRGQEGSGGWMVTEEGWRQ